MAKGHYTEYSKWLLEDFGDIRKFFVRGGSVCWKYDVAEKKDCFMEMRGVINCSLLKTGGTSGRRYLSSRT